MGQATVARVIQTTLREDHGTNLGPNTIGGRGGSSVREVFQRLALVTSVPCGGHLGHKGGVETIHTGGVSVGSPALNRALASGDGQGS